MKRGGIELYISILRSIDKGIITYTKIYSDSQISGLCFMSMLTHLVGSGLVSKEPNTIRPHRMRVNHEKPDGRINFNYRITNEGKEIIRKYIEVERLLYIKDTAWGDHVVQG